MTARRRTARPRWIDSPMADPWFRDWVAGIVAEHTQDLEAWAEQVASVYGREGTLEVTACIWALLDRIDAVTHRRTCAADADTRPEEEK